MTENKQRVVAVIPCYNTAAHIYEVVSLARKHVDEVIVVDDGSTDDTARIAREAGARVISHGKNLGKGAAMRQGAQVACQAEDIIIFLDGDGQHNPNQIPLFIKPIREHKMDMVVGARFLPSSKLQSRPPFFRNLSNLIASIVISVFVSIPIHKRKRLRKIKALPKRTGYRVIRGPIKWFTDCTCGFRAIRVDGWKQLKLVSSGYQIETEMIFEAVKNDLIIAEIPVSCTWRGKLSKLSIIKDGLRTIQLLTNKLLTSRHNYYSNSLVKPNSDY